MEKRSGPKKAVDNGASKKARILRNESPVAKEPQQDEGKEDIKTIDAALDPKTLQCPLCSAPFDGAIFQASTVFFVHYSTVLVYCVPFLSTLYISFCDEQCKNGHAACGSCSRAKGTCASCCEPIGDIRCRPLEHAIASMTLPCAFTTNGCTRRLKFAEKHAHEALLCAHAPCSCPIKACAYSGMDLHDHIRQTHAGGDAGVVSFVRSTQVALRRDAPFRVLLDAVDKRVFLLLNGGGVVPTGQALSVVCVGHRPDGNQALLEYRMDVSAGGAAAALSLSASGPVPCIRRWVGHHPTDVFLFVPDAYWSYSGSVNVTVEVWKPTVDKA
ncbi:hypothetical protein PR202_gb26593 [Eleusine coracana subsp. coracana]|uniref:SIAH-type domain-containing protein n=1 Tax=Eleusine coracana subsp. coracana TaxID=191504 RepID=A0AAV5FPL9_ELECO|nr:hypothetical protein PR202_gb26593 [Eleusine coracana subsp. coracana]